jgi:NADH:ubiquinone oxidoreductase subunit 4 (subunit M)
VGLAVDTDENLRACQVFAPVVATVMVLLMGVYPSPFIQFTRIAAEQLTGFVLNLTARL